MKFWGILWGSKVLVGQQPCWGVDDHAICGQIDGWNDLSRERNKGCSFASTKRHFQQVVSAVVQDRLDAAHLRAACVDHVQIDQVSVVKFVIRQTG